MKDWCFYELLVNYWLTDLCLRAISIGLGRMTSLYYEGEPDGTN